jgi:hypothetical protein
MRMFAMRRSRRSTSFTSLGGAGLTVSHTGEVLGPSFDYPRPTNGMFVAMTVRNNTLASSGSDAM